MNAIENVSRRSFLNGLFSAGAFVLAARVLPEDAWAQTAVGGVRTRAEGAPLTTGVYLGIEPDGTVFIVTHRSEMGTGIRTTLPMVAADELDADWTRVRIEQGIGDVKYGDQNTDGSRSIRDFYTAFRQSGAAARAMLVSAAATQLQVPAAELTTASHEVIHQASGRRVPYAALVAAASTLPVPKPDALQFKPKTAWKYIGQERAIYDQTDILTGKAQFGLDIFRDGMVHAIIERPPVYGGRLRSVDDTAARAVKGVRETVNLEPLTPPYRFKPLGGVAVIADSTWAAMQGRRQLKVQWDDGPNASFNSDTYRTQLLAAVAKPGKVVRNVGNVDAEFAKTGTVLEATYYTPLLAHASMEPPAAVAEYRDGKVTIWAPQQNPQATQDSVAEALGLKKEDVVCHVTLLGGGFGRKSKPDFAVEAALLSKQVGRPVKVIWTREDDIRFDYYHACAAVHQRATVDAKGRPTAWLQRSAFPPIASMFDASARTGLGFEVDMGLVDLPYDVANIRAENGDALAPVRIGWFRSVCNIFHAFAAHAFADEMAAAAGRDRVEYLLDLLGPGRTLDLKAQGVEYSNYGAPTDRYPIDIARLRRVIEVAAEKSGWARRTSGGGSGIGIAAHRSFNSYVASVVEVEVDAKGGLKVPRVHQVVDAGVIVNPDRVRAQFEGAAVMAVGLARTGEITATNGRINQSNYNNFPVARMGDAPYQTDVHFIESDAPPTGVGEPGVPPVLTALCNAIFAATGKRIRELPLSRQKLV